VIPLDSEDDLIDLAVLYAGSCFCSFDSISTSCTTAFSSYGTGDVG
jgi:hypothetical protein